MYDPAQAWPMIGVSSLTGSRSATATSWPSMDLTFEVPAGELFGFVGRNGAGKTTAMRIVVGVLTADAGDVRFGGSP